jgi:cytosine/adenosine deaminase-related metal-dependent hydrolase
MSSLIYDPANRDELRALMASGVLALMRSGVTTIVNQNGADAAWLLELLIECGVRAYSGPNLPSSTQARGTVDAQGNVVRIPTAAEAARTDVEDIIALHAKYDQGLGGRVRVIAGPASAEICGDELLLALASLDKQWGVPLTLHLAQSEHDVAQSQTMFDKTSAAHLKDLGLLGPNLIAAHSSLLTEDDVQLFRESGATVAHCASRKAKEGVFGPFQRYVDSGVRVALGNDAFTLDFVEEVRLAAMFGKLATGTARKPTAANALSAATEAGADAVERKDLGRIEVGAKADLCLVDLTSPFVAPVRDPIMSFIYYASGADIRHVWTDGRRVVADGVCTTLDQQAILAKAIAAAEKIWRLAAERGILK